MNSNDVTDDDVLRAANSAVSMSAAAKSLNLKYRIFKKRAVELGCFKTNQSGKGTQRPLPVWNKVPLTEILNGEHPNFQTFKLKHRLLKEGILQNCCSVCGLSVWWDKEIQCELDHIDGNKFNHSLENLRMLCPNCHSQTVTYRGKNKGRYGR